MEEQQEKKIKLDNDNGTFELGCQYRVPYDDVVGLFNPLLQEQGLPFPPGPLPVSSHCVVEEDGSSLTITMQHGAYCEKGPNGTYEDAILAILRDWLLLQLDPWDFRKPGPDIEAIMEMAAQRFAALKENNYKTDCTILVPYELMKPYIPYDPQDPRGLPFPPGPLPYGKHCIVSEDRNSFTIKLKPWSAGPEVEGDYIEVLAAVVRDLLMFKNQRSSPLCCREFSGAITDVEHLISQLSDMTLFTLSPPIFIAQVHDALRLVTSALHWLHRRAACLQAKGQHGTPK